MPTAESETGRINIHDPLPDEPGPKVTVSLYVEGELITRRTHYRNKATTKPTAICGEPMLGIKVKADAPTCPRCRELGEQAV